MTRRAPSQHVAPGGPSPRILGLLSALLLTCAQGWPLEGSREAAAARASPRAPRDVALCGERWLLVLEEGAASLALLDRVTSALLDELALEPDSRPRAFAVTTSPDGRILAAVCETLTHSAVLVELRFSRAGDAGAVAKGGSREPDSEPTSPRLELLARRTVGRPPGRLPGGAAFDREARRLWIACEADGHVRELDAVTLEPLRSLEAVEGARRVVAIEGREAEALGHPTGLLAVAGRTALGLVDLASGRVLASHEVAGGLARNIEGLAVAGGTAHLAHQVQPSESPVEPQILDWGLILVNRLTSIDLAALLRAGGAGKAVAGQADSLEEDVRALDMRGRSAGDPAAVAALPDGRGLLVLSAGSDRLLFLDRADHGVRADASSLGPRNAYGRIPDLRVGDRPTGLAVTPDGKLAYVASFLEDAVLEVDLERRAVTGTLRLGAPLAETPALRGARDFFDSDRSRDGWYSCHSCHPDGVTRGHSFNTLADGRGLAKRSPPLQGVLETGPWSWRGRFDSLEEQVAASIEKTMARLRQPPREEVSDLIAFLATLPRARPTTPGEDLGGDPTRGARLFEQVECSECHAPPAYTIDGARDIGLEASFDGVTRYNPPSLRGVRDRFRFLHDGRAATLEAVFQEHNTAGRHGRAAALTPGELADLLAFVRTL